MKVEGEKGLERVSGTLGVTLSHPNLSDRVVCLGKMKVEKSMYVSPTAP